MPSAAGNRNSFGVYKAPFLKRMSAGLLDLIRKGYFKKGEKVLFLHTGGAPGLYAYQDVLLD